MKPIQFEGYEFYSVAEDGTVINRNTGKVLKPDLNYTGYKRVTLWCKEFGRRREFVHRLVAIHYIDNPDNLPMVNHIDGVKINTHYTNLEWITCRGNTNHAFRTGLRKGANKLSPDVVKLVKVLHNEGWSRKRIAEQLGCKESRISDALYRYKY
jgi:DNA-directed RNA polymerase specialized sigma24 family protein